VRLDRVHVDGRVQRERVGDHVAPLAGRNVEMLPCQPQQRRRQRGRAIAEVQPEGRLHGLGPAAGTKVQHHQEIGTRAQGPRHPGWRHVRGVPRSPIEEVPVRALHAVRDQPLVTSLGILGVEPPRRSGPIELHRRVVDDAGIAGKELPRPDVACDRAGNRQDEVPVHVIAGGPQRVDRRLQDQVGLAELPASRPLRQRRQQRGISFHRALVAPRPQGGDLRVRQPPIA
jgi:hypothetical protein